MQRIHLLFLSCRVLRVTNRRHVICSPALSQMQGTEERRMDPADGNMYTQAEFIDAYGGTVEWNAAASGKGNHGCNQTRTVLPDAQTNKAQPLSRAEEIRAKIEEKKARVAAFSAQKRAERAAAEAKLQAEAEARAAADQQMRAAAELRAREAAEAQANAARQAEIERRAAEEAEAKARELQAKYDTAAAKKKEIARKAAAKREAALASPVLPQTVPAVSTAAQAAAANDPWGFATIVPAPSPAPVVETKSTPTAPAPIAHTAFKGLGQADSLNGTGVQSLNQPREYTVELPRAPNGFGLKINDKSSGDAFVEGFTHGRPSSLGVVLGSTIVSVAGVPVRGRGQNGVIMVLKHPQYGGNPALPSVRFDLIMPVNSI